MLNDLCEVKGIKSATTYNMKKNIETTIKIKASAEKIWSILTDFQKYPEWNPFVLSMEGEAKEGTTLKANIQGMKFKPIVLAAKTNKEFRWLGSLFVKGLFDGEHYFVLNENGDGTTTLIHGEFFGGLLVSLFSKALDTKTKSGFEKLNEALKQRAERN
jgi:hypothetical protein